MTEAWSFAQLDDFWSLFEPLSPWGRDEQQARRVHTSLETLEGRYDDIDAAEAFLGRNDQDPVRLDRLRFHLRRLPRIPQAESAEYELLELFQVKKFLSNYRGLLANLDGPALEYFGLHPVCSELAASLDRGGSDAETFYLVDSYHPGLGPLREALRRLDQDIQAADQARQERLKAEYGLDFAGRDFLLIARVACTDAMRADRLLSFEAYDEKSLLVRPVEDSGGLAMAERRHGLLQTERELEALVLADLSASLRQGLAELLCAIDAIRRLDWALAGAMLARRFSLVRPRFSPAGRPELIDGRYLPCQMECQRLGLHYQPLTIECSSQAVVLFGSNMGGKTVVLKSLLFFQLLAQAGLFVPAMAFHTRIFDHIEYVGELSGQRLAGLSGFGFEIWRFRQVWELENALIAFDELARTTGSHEAEALLGAIVGSYARGQGGGLAAVSSQANLALFSTHFRGIARQEGAQYLRMRGLDQAAAHSAMGQEQSLAGRLADINRHMCYQVVADNNPAGQDSDALAIAAMLGLDPALIEAAGGYLARPEASNEE